MSTFFKKLLHYLIKLRGKIFIPFVIFYIWMAAYIALILEPQNFDSYLNALYWVLTTLATVGFGDYSPVTNAGKIFTIGLYITGIGLISVFIKKSIGSAKRIENLKVGGKMTFKGKDHIILIGWSEKSKLAIQEILKSDEKTEVILIDHLGKIPIMEERVFYVRGDAADEETLLQANLTKAKGVIIFADQIIEENQAVINPLFIDGKTLLIATAITSIEKKMNTPIHVTVEVINEKHIRLFKHVKVDEFIPTQEMISHAAVRSIFSHGVTRMYSELMSRQCDEGMYQIPKQNHWKSYRDAFTDLIDKGATLVADRGDLHINHKLDQPIPDDAQLYVICTEETFSEISSEKAH
ncbi:potassium channel protein [Ammoniphilus resinae]|uniref:Voltage-gated potassium channel n=1 Tax=Ammoniphilus resinae TaxID=861532 RepID=A0ABS4GVB6_9BACL|nr:potassium channel protein [Ammoniphilus resinae]MBP1934213.1 voltage-gated potassium channel [Ammoniphilus resinae]